MRTSVTNLRQEGPISGSVFVQLALAAAPCAPTCHEALRARVLQEALDGAPPTGTITFRAADRAWYVLAPGVEIKLLSPGVAGCLTAFVRMAAGARFGSHEHVMREECLVLSGEIQIGGHHLRTGDLHIADAGTAHTITYAPNDALLFVRTARVTAP